MIVTKAVTKKWGNSIGIVIPQSMAKKDKIKIGQKLDVVIMKPDRFAEEIMDMAREQWNEQTKKIKEHIKKELSKD